MYDHLEIMIKMRYAELLEDARVGELLAESKAQLLSRAERLSQDTIEDASNLTYVVSTGQEESVLKSPNTKQLFKAAKNEMSDEMMTEDDLSEVIFFKKSVF